MNSHFLCEDALNAIEGIEKHGVPEGTLKPIVEELYVALQKDPVFNAKKDSPLKYFLKAQGENYRISTKIMELNYQELKKAVQVINTKFFSAQVYYNELKDRIITLIERNDTNDQLELFRLVKSLLTELINSGYDQQYIYWVMDNLLWTVTACVDSPTLIRRFFEKFTFKTQPFSVVFKVDKRKTNKFISHFEDLNYSEKLAPKSASPAEKKFLEKRNGEAFLVIERISFDPFSAARSAQNMLSLNLALYRINDHVFRFNFKGVWCGVYAGDEFFFLPKNISAVSHIKTPSNRQIKEYFSTSEKAIRMLASNHEYSDSLDLINAASFHAQALDSNSEQNQLLDFWAIFESILKISNIHTSDRINQICSYLVPIIKRNYLYSLFLQLSSDIRVFSEELYIELIGNCESDRDVVNKLCTGILLNPHGERESLLSACAQYPLLKERVEYYISKLSKPRDIYDFVEKHAERVKWQVMRIYRNRNLIIHNGKSMPYLGLLVENLHSYVDDFLSYVIQSLARGNSVSSMCQELYVKECDWISAFTKKGAELDEEMINQMLSI